MGIFDKLFGTGKASGVVNELQTLREDISILPVQCPALGVSFGGGARQAQEQIPIICQNIDQAVKALKTGLDPNQRPITKQQISAGLKNLVNATRKPAFIGLMTVVLNGDGIKLLENHLNNLERIANGIS